MADNYEYLYRPLLERSLENYQVQYLARNYDFGKESRVAALIVAEVNTQIEKTEAQLGIRRVQPFHLYLKWKAQELFFPLFASEYLEPIFNSCGGFRASREMMTTSCRKEARKAKMAPVERWGWSIRTTSYDTGRDEKARSLPWTSGGPKTPLGVTVSESK